MSRVTFRLTTVVVDAHCIITGVREFLIDLAVVITVGLAALLLLSDVAVIVAVVAVLLGTNGNHTPFQNNSDDGDLILLASFQW